MSLSATPLAAEPVEAGAVARRVIEVEIAALRQLAESLDGAFDRAVETVLAARGRIILTGVGKSGHVARKIAATFASTGTPAHYVHPTEASHGDLGMVTGEDVLIALSKSGGATELSDLIAYAARFDIPLIAMTAAPGSALGRAATILLRLPDAQEACGETNAPTSSTTMMMALGDAVAVAVLERRGFRAEHFKLFHPGGRLGAMLKTASDLMHAGSGMPLTPHTASLAEAVKEISDKGFGIVGVTDPAGRLAGVVTDGDLRRLIASGRRAEGVQEVMTRTPMTDSPTALAATVLRRLTETKRTALFLVDDDGRPVGIVHMHDLLKAGLA